MNTLVELGVRLIKCENRKSDDKIRRIQEEANHLLYKYQRKPITRIVCEMLMKSLKDYGTELKNHTEKDIYTPRKTEVLSMLRVNYSILKEYHDNPLIIPTKEDKERIRKEFNYIIGDYINDKKNKVEYCPYEYLKRFREVYDYYYMPYKVNVGEDESILKTSRSIVKELEKEVTGWM